MLIQRPGLRPICSEVAGPRTVCESCQTHACQNLERLVTFLGPGELELPWMSPHKHTGAGEEGAGPSKRQTASVLRAA